jgi:hypothetical protein
VALLENGSNRPSSGSATALKTVRKCTQLTAAHLLASDLYAHASLTDPRDPRICSFPFTDAFNDFMTFPAKNLTTAFPMPITNSAAFAYPSSLPNLPSRPVITATALV